MYEIHLDRIDSTNTYAKIHAKEFPSDQITCITAEEQTAGRGRYQRKWVSPRSVNLLVSFSFFLPKQTLHLTSLAQVMAYSLAKVLQAEGLHPQIKWPNDILLSGKKVAGILCELEFEKEIAAIFLGMGINVNLGQKEADQIDQPATSLFLETGKKWDRKALLKKVQTQFAGDLQTFKKEGFEAFREHVENWLAYKGQTVRCYDGKKEWVGICHSLANNGGLKLSLPDHSTVTLLSGEVNR